ncbi:MAG TPA: PspA/IM30 family protein, partial [Aliiroseovarius sp.]|nr:PspA/IM30 family protein [Aliiroseovarius sp.]
MFTKGSKMFGTLKTLIIGSNARAEEHVRKVYSIELIEQKIREGTQGLKRAKNTLVAIRQRQRVEERQIATLTTRIDDLVDRARKALDAGQDDLAGEAAEAIARLENERDMRRATADKLETRAIRLQANVEAAHRRILDLKQGAIAARAARQDAQVMRGLNTTLAGQDSLSEAEELIRSVLGEDDPFEQAE